MPCALLIACLAIAGCNPDAAEIHFEVKADHSGDLTYTALLRAGPDPTTPGVIAPMAGVADVHAVDVSFRHVHAEFARVEDVDFGGIRLKLSSDANGRLMTVTVPAAQNAAWRSVAPDVATVLSYQSLQFEAESRASPERLPAERLGERAKQAADRRCIALFVKLPGDVVVTDVDASAGALGWRVEKAGDTAMLFIPLVAASPAAAASQDVIVWETRFTEK